MKLFYFLWGDLKFFKKKKKKKKKHVLDWSQ